MTGDGSRVRPQRVLGAPAASSRRVVLLVGAVFLIGVVVAAVGIDVRASWGARTTADEPQYLLTAISLFEDRSLDISDEIARERYEPFHEIGLNRQTEPLDSGAEISPHDPLLPVLLAIPMELGGWRAAKLTLAVVNGLLGALLLWTMVTRLGVRPTAGAVVTGTFAASAPFAVYGNQVYPELPAALAVAAGIAALTGPLRAGAAVVAGASVVALPWLSVKYVPVAAGLAGVALVRLWRNRTHSNPGSEPQKAAGREAWWFAGGLALSGALYIGAHLAWYGGLTVYSTGDHFQTAGEFSVVGTAMDPIGRARRLIGLLVDDKFGLAAWQPAFLFALPAMGAVAVRRPAWLPAVAVPAALGWLNATFVALTMQGWWWPGRQVVVILPALVLAVAWWVDRGGPRRLVWFVIAGLAGVVSYLWLVVEGLRDQLTWVVDFFETSNPLYRTWSEVLPDYLDVTARTWMLHGAWIVVAAGAVYLGVRSERALPEGTLSESAATRP